MLASTLAMIVNGTAALAQGAPPDPQEGHAMARQFCASCHLVSARQRGPVPDGLPSFMSIADRYEVDAEYLRTILLDPPHPMMPDPPLSNRQIDDVVAYILSLRER